MKLTVAVAVGGTHVAPGVVGRSGLDVPDVTTVPGKVAGLESVDNSLAVADGATGSVDEPDTLLHLLDGVGVDEAASRLVERAVDGDDVAAREELVEGVDALGRDSLGSLSGDVVVVEPEELLAVEGLEALEDTVADTATADGTDDLALEVIGVTGDLGDVPLVVDDLLMGGDEVADEDEHGHDDVLGNRDDIGAGDLSDSDLALVGSVEVDVVGTDTGGDTELEVLGLVDQVGGEVAGVEGGGDEDLGVDNVLLELGVGALLVVGNDDPRCQRGSRNHTYG